MEAADSSSPSAPHIPSAGTEMTTAQKNDAKLPMNESGAERVSAAAGDHDTDAPMEGTGFPQVIKCFQS